MVYLYKSVVYRDTSHLWSQVWSKLYKHQLKSLILTTTIVQMSDIHLLCMKNYFPRANGLKDNKLLNIAGVAISEIYTDWTWFI